MSKMGCDPKDIHMHAWLYFENALSIHSHLLFYPQSGLTAIQALTLMVCIVRSTLKLPPRHLFSSLRIRLQSFFAENVLGSSVEYMLCSNAVRLAQSLGLNHEPESCWNMGLSEISQRSRIWWALYCYDKHISMREGRQSCIDDDE